MRGDEWSVAGLVKRESSYMVTVSFMSDHFLPVGAEGHTDTMEGLWISLGCGCCAGHLLSSA